MSDYNSASVSIFFINTFKFEILFPTILHNFARNFKISTFYSYQTDLLRYVFFLHKQLVIIVNNESGPKHDAS